MEYDKDDQEVDWLKQAARVLVVCILAAFFCAGIVIAHN